MKCRRPPDSRGSLALLLCALIAPGCIVAATDMHVAPAEGIDPQAVVDVLRSDPSLEVKEASEDDPGFYQSEEAIEHHCTLLVSVSRGEALTLVEISGQPPEIRVLTCLIRTPNISEVRDPDTGELEVNVDTPGVTDEEMAEMLELQDHVTFLITDAFPEIEIGAWRHEDYWPPELE